MIRRASMVLLAVGLVAGNAAAAPGDLRLHRLVGPMTPADLRALRAALDETHARGEIVLFAIDSPGGALALGENAMIATLFSGAPVVAWVPPGGRASGAATLALMATGLVVVAPSARLGTRTGLGRDLELRLGAFGNRLFEAAQSARSGAVDWLVVSLADGSEVDGRGAVRRGIAVALARTPEAVARALRGREVSIPLTGARVRASGRLREAREPIARRLSAGLRPPARAVPAFFVCFLLVALLPGVRPSGRWGLFALGAVGLAAGALRGIPVAPIAAALAALAWLALWAAPHAGPWAAGLGGALAAGAMATFVDAAAPGYYFAPDAGPSLAVSAVAGATIALVAGFVTWRARRAHAS